MLLQSGVPKEIIPLCSGDSLLVSNSSSECRESWDGAVGTWLGTDSYRILSQRWEENGQWRDMTWSCLEIGYLRSRGIRLFSYCLVSLEENRIIEWYFCVSFKSGAGVAQEVRSPEFDFLVCCGCLLSWASLFPSLCLSFFLCNIMLMSLCCIWVLSVELGWRDRQGPAFSVPVGSDRLWWWKTVFICICLLAHAQTSFMPCTWVDDSWENLDVGF